VGTEPGMTGWLQRQAEKEARKDIMPFSERYGQLVGVVITVLVVLFFVVHQTDSTGFFTSEFGAVEAFLLYAALLWGLIPLLAKFVLGRKNVVRPLELFGSCLFLVATAYLLAVFPFDFAHLADPLPGFLEFVLDWISDGIAKVLLAIGVVVTVLLIPYTLLLYRAVRRELAKPPVPPPPQAPQPTEPTPP